MTGKKFDSSIGAARAYPAAGRIVGLVAALIVAAGVSGSPAGAATVFTQSIGAIGPGESTITFDEFSLGDDIIGATAVPGHDVTLTPSTPFRVGGPVVSPDPRFASGLFEGNVIFQPTGSIASGSFFVDFDTDVSAVGLGLANDDGSIEHLYVARVFNRSGDLLGEMLNIPVAEPAEFLGFTSDLADIARFELAFGATTGTGQRPAIDTITYNGAGAAAVPLPAAAPLLAASLGLFGLFGWRRREAVAD